MMTRSTTRHGRYPQATHGAAGLLLLLLAWEVAGRMHLAGRTLPPLTSVLSLYRPGWKLSLLLRSARSTVSAAGLGLLLGLVLGTATAVLTHLLPSLRPGLDRMAALVQAAPAIALGPILIITVGREGTPVMLATLPVFFLNYVAVSSGLRSAGRTLTQAFGTLGAARWQRMVYLEAPSAIPSLVTGMKLSVSAAMIGAIVGEWFGASTGLGIVILNTMQNFQIPLMWAAVLAVALISMGAYGALSLLERRVRRRFA